MLRVLLFAIVAAISAAEGPVNVPIDQMTMNSFMSLRWGPCTIGTETVENYIIRRCEDAGGGYTWERVVACSSKKDVMGNRIEIDQQYTDERFQYLCHFNGTEGLLVYEPIKCIAHDGHFMEPGMTYFNENDGHIANCTRTATGLSITFADVPVCYDSFGKQHQLGTEWTEEGTFVMPPMIGTRFNCGATGNNQFSAEAIACVAGSKEKPQIVAVNSMYTAPDGNTYNCIGFGQYVYMEQVLMTCYSYNGTQYPIGAKWDERTLAQRFECVMNNGEQSPHADAIAFRRAFKQDFQRVCGMNFVGNWCGDGHRRLNDTLRRPTVDEQYSADSGCLVGPNKDVFVKGDRYVKVGDIFYYCRQFGDRFVAIPLRAQQTQCRDGSGMHYLGDEWVFMSVEYQCIFHYPYAFAHATGEQFLQFNDAYWQAIGCILNSKVLAIGSAAISKEDGKPYRCQGVSGNRCILEEITMEEYESWLNNGTYSGGYNGVTASGGHGSDKNFTTMTTVGQPGTTTHAVTDVLTTETTTVKQTETPSATTTEASGTISTTEAEPSLSTTDEPTSVTPRVGKQNFCFLPQAPPVAHGCM